MSWLSDKRKQKLVDKICKIDVKVERLEKSIDDILTNLQSLKEKSDIGIYNYESQLEDLRFKLRSLIFDLDEIEGDVGVDEYISKLRSRILYNYERIHNGIMTIIS